MMIRFILVLLFGIFFSAEVFSQRVIYGTVKDINDNPLPGATVSVKELTSVGTVSDVDGRYELELPDNKTYTLKISFVGYYDVIKKTSNVDDTELNFRLEENSTMLEQVVVTGTRTPKLLKDVPIVTRVISEIDIKNVDAVNIGDLLQSELPGIEFTYSMNQQLSLNMSGFGGNSVLF